MPLSGEELVRRELLSELGLDLLFGSSSDLFRELYEKQLVHDELWSGYDALGGVAYAMVGADTACPEEFPGRLLDGIGSHLDAALSHENFERKKRGAPQRLRRRGWDFHPEERPHFREFDPCG